MIVENFSPLTPEGQAARILELDRVLALVAAKACTASAKALLLDLRPAPATEILRLREDLHRTAAFMVLVRECGSVPLAGVEDLNPFLEEIRFPESWLPPRELLVIVYTFAALERVRDYRDEAAERAADLFTPVASVFADIGSFAPLKRLIESCINEEEEIRDNASLELKDIRRRITSSRRQISTQLNEILSNPEFEPLIQDNLVTIRNQRYVLPLRTNFRSAIPGIIHDHSRTRQTCFVEPLESVSLNNNLALLLQEEKQEEINILRMLGDRLRQTAPLIIETLEKILALDQLQAKALFGEQIKASAPVLLESWDAGFALKSARHPLLIASSGSGVLSVVPIDIEFPAGRCGLVISGANTGGKTVSLKTTGLIALMARCGLLLPVAPESRVPLFSMVLAAIGDEQNLAASLSTFSGHLLAVKTILAEADARSLILLDELGVGTDPKEGAALAQAVLIELKERRAIFMVTTHYNDVKSYAYEEEGISSVAVAFDPANFRPLYHLQYGVPGLSNALLIARNLGFSQALVDRAHSLLDEGENRTTNLAAQLEKRLAHTANHEKELLHLKQQARIEGDRQQRLIAELEIEKEKVKTSAREQVALLVKEARLKFKVRLTELEAVKNKLETALKNAGKAALKELPEVKVGKLRNAFNEARDEVYGLLPKPVRAPVKVDYEKLEVGDRVQVAGQTKAATIVAIDSSRQRLTVVLDGNLRVTLTPDKISQHLPATGFGAGKESSVKIRNIAAEDGGSGLGRGALGVSGATRVLNLIGKRVDEAADLLSVFIDQAIVDEQLQVEIVHGHGTGRLRQGIHEILKTLPYVSKFSHPDAAAGGAAITIVELVQR